MSQISQRDAQSMERRLDTAAENRRHTTTVVSEVFAGFVSQFASGWLQTKNPKLAGFGPGDRFNLDHVLAIGGLYLGRRRGRNSAFARGTGIAATGSFGREMGIKAASA